MNRTVEGKTCYLPKVRVQESRRKLYESALAVRQESDPDLTLSDWVRRSLDDQAARDLNQR